MLTHRSVVASVTLALLAALGPLTEVGPLRAGYGLAGLWIYLVIFVPQGWAMGVMTYTLLNPATVTGDDRDATLWRWLRWSPLAGRLIQQGLLIVTGAVAGGWLARMAEYGRVLGRTLRKRNLVLEMIPGHPDGAAGLKPIGGFHRSRCSSRSSCSSSR